MAGYSPTPLLKKLGMKDGMHALLLAVPPSLPEISRFAGFAHCQTGLDTGSRDRDYIHWFTTEQRDIVDHLDVISTRLRPDGLMWLSWPKRASKMQTDITEDVLRTLILPTMLVDVKVCALNEIWSGLKFVWRSEHRINVR